MSVRTRLIRLLRHWHARIGVLAALFFIFLVVSGIALNHTDALRLDQRKVSAHWLMQWYGLKAERPAQGYLFDQGYFSWSGQQWVMDGQVIGVNDPPLGATEVAGTRYVATASALYLYLPDGRLVDKLQGAALPATPLLRIGSHEALLLADTPQGVFASSDGLTWQPHPAAEDAWVQVQPLPLQARQHLAALFAPSLPLERVLLDLHSGRLFGRYGPLLMDMIAGILMLLALSGVWIYWRTIRKR